MGGDEGRGGEVLTPAANIVKRYLTCRHENKDKTKCAKKKEKNTTVHPSPITTGNLVAAKFSTFLWYSMTISGKSNLQLHLALPRVGQPPPPRPSWYQTRRIERERKCTKKATDGHLDWPCLAAFPFLEQGTVSKISLKYFLHTAP